MNVNTLFHMDQYGIYVWTTYGITLTVFLLNIAMVCLEKKSIRKFIKHYMAQVTQSK